MAMDRRFAILSTCDGLDLWSSTAFGKLRI
jgi:hypothetical protein